jgi:hypothetical protein
MTHMRSFFDIAADIAAGQHGRVSRVQLLDAGVDPYRIRRWLADGRLRPAHWGVYALGHEAPSWRADYMAAQLAGGPGAAISHHAGTKLLSLRRGQAPLPEVSVTTTGARRRPGIVIHRVKSLAGDVAEVDGIRVTTCPRTLLDLAPSTAPEELTRLCHEAWIHHRMRPHHIEACIARNPTKPGAAKLRQSQRADVLLSDLEHRFVALLKAHRLPRPRTNIDHQGDKVDCHWPDHGGLTIELLSYRYHATRHAFEQDVARRRRSDYVAFTYGDVVERAGQTADEVGALLAACQLSA